MTFQLAFAVLTACSPSPPSAPVAPPSPAVEAAAPRATVVFAQASVLNLREAAAPNAPLRGKLGINSPLEVLDEAGTFLRVRTGNGREGFVDAQFVGPERLTVEAALQQAQVAQPPLESLSWAQRAAALSDADAVLAVLEDAYRRTGDEPAALRVAEARRWPHRVLLASASGDGSWDVEWPWGDTRDGVAGQAPTPVPLGPLLAKRSIAADTPWWALPASGPPVPVRPRDAVHVHTNECAGTYATVVRFDGLEAPPVAVAFGALPEGWSRPTRTPPVTREAAERALREALAPEEGATVEVALVPLEDRWFGRVVATTSPVEDEMPLFHFVDAVIGASGVTVLREEKDWASYLGPKMPTASVDVVGDATLEVVWADTCSTLVTDAQGQVLRESASRCCGC